MLRLLEARCDPLLCLSMCLEVGRPSVTCCRQVTLSETPPLLRRLACSWSPREVGVRAMERQIIVLVEVVHVGASCACRLPGPSVLVQQYCLLMSSSTGTKQPTGTWTCLVCMLLVFFEMSM